MKTMAIILSSLLLVGVNAAFSGADSKMAPDFRARTTDGEELSLAQFRGKVVLLDFWASWCKPCQQEFPFLVDLYRDNMERDFVVLAINLDEDATKMRKFLKGIHLPVKFPIITDPKGKIPALYKISHMPTTILIDQKGEIEYEQGGFQNSDEEKLMQVLSALLDDGQTGSR